MVNCLQAVRNQLKKVGLLPLEHRSDEFQLLVKMIGMMVYLPPKQIQAYWFNGVRSYVT